MLQDAAEIIFLTSRIIPGVESTSKEYLAIYSKVKPFRQLGKRLQMLTKHFGIGVLGLLLSGPSFPSFSLTDHMWVRYVFSTANHADQTRLFDININDFAEFATLLEEKQGTLLRKLSNSIAPALSALAAFHQSHDVDVLPTIIDVEKLKDIPKALLTLSPDNSRGV